MALIRAATVDDVERLADVGVRSYEDHFAALWTPAGLAAFLTQHFARPKLLRELGGGAGVRYALVLDGDATVGFAKMNEDRPIPPAFGARGLELEKIYFTRAATGHGFGGALMSHVFATAAEIGAATVWLDVLKSNLGGIRFYERHGFMRAGELPFTTDRGEPIGMWVMTRAIEPRRPARR